MKAMYSKRHRGLLSPPTDDILPLLFFVLILFTFNFIQHFKGNCVKKGKKSSDNNTAAGRRPAEQAESHTSNQQLHHQPPRLSMLFEKRTIFCLQILCSVFFCLSLKEMIRARLGWSPEILLAANFSPKLESTAGLLADW